MYVSADTASPSSAHHQFAVRSSEKNVGTVLMNGYATYTRAIEQHQLDELVAGEPGDRLGADLVDAGLGFTSSRAAVMTAFASRHGLSDPQRHSGFRESA